MADLSRREFERALAELGSELRRQIECSVEGFEPDPAAAAQRRARAQDDFRFFAHTYFPHYLDFEDSELHSFLYQELPTIVNDPRGVHLAVAAPRGEAKSTIVALIFVIWCVLTGRKHYIILIMDAFEQAAEHMESLRAELDSNPRLLNDYPKATGQGRVWREGVIVTRNNVKIQGAGSGKKIRGRRHGPHRPDLVIGDDLENDENVVNPAQRDKLEGWLKKTVLQLGDASGRMDAIVIGTILHYDSVLNRLLSNPLWRRRRFQALIDWPDRMDLWEQFEERLLNRGEDDAMRFYGAHRAAMDAGARVSWPSARPLVRLMIVRARDGHDTFDSEYQNDPINSANATFGTIILWAEENPRWVFLGACDPSLGKFGKQRDPSAILVGGFDRETGLLDVVEARIKKRVPDLIIETIIELQRVYRCHAWAIESVQFQEFLRTELVKRSAAAGVPVPAVGVTPGTDKSLRIESLQPHLANGLIRLHSSQTTLLQQLRHWPKADHDDGPDALHMLWSLALSRLPGSGRIVTRRRTGGADYRGY
jgi:predicted phage terminase large subunit-like protein